MNIQVFPRLEVPSHKPERPFAWIRISDPGKGPGMGEGVPEHFMPFLTGCLHLEFWDSETVDQMPGGFWTDENKPPTLPLPVLELFQHDQAEEILCFVESNIVNGVKDFIINCEGGFSRSPAVAVALARLYGTPELEWEVTQGKYPNGMVYRTILEASETII